MMMMQVRKRYLEELAMIRREVGEEGVSSDDEDDEGYPPSPPGKVTHFLGDKNFQI